MFNFHWPGVISGLSEYLASTKVNALVPFAVVPNKVYLARQAYAPFYRDSLREVSTSLLKSGDLFGHQVDVYTEWSEFQVDHGKLLGDAHAENSHLLQQVISLRSELATLRASKRLRLANALADTLNKALRR